MGTAIKYLEDVDRFEAFLDLGKEEKSSDKVVVSHSLFSHNNMKNILFELMQELKDKYKNK